uniref:Serine/threonine/tyrosine-interacting protein-like n=1 Tax=Phallusia mammillata TaxID=59560 RepID=A0A6F9DTC1_9ASCI|nr:serine/threonine/tyrosine-interacting protein-like [Phallusia mammillata]
MESRIIRPNFPDHFKYLIVEVADNPFENILIHFEQVIQFMQICIQNKGCVLVHGNAGMSRSAAFVVAFLMQQYEASFVDAYAHVKNKRFCVNLNLGFIHQLKEFEPIYKAKVGSDENSATCGGLKRNASEANFSINYMDT